ncbi:hypothetical protein J8273_6443 [Carpediemonas membranifera]|uniref:Tetratricopeptide repeat protein n=1 Tax=Carpediemonas membranifera TaxID=201153 RepID=A0A8J6E2A5_9EUKA|nr:hypothetical protein J8273_6443 [Carpediemonas membranifera]|eukprot:KAG9391672.1 hypothetical protein J8273_6443 [Carpediemonas membranifera]
MADRDKLTDFFGGKVPPPPERTFDQREAQSDSDYAKALFNAGMFNRAIDVCLSTLDTNFKDYDHKSALETIPDDECVTDEPIPDDSPFIIVQPPVAHDPRLCEYYTLMTIAICSLVSIRSPKELDDALNQIPEIVSILRDGSIAEQLLIEPYSPELAPTVCKARRVLNTAPLGLLIGIALGPSIAQNARASVTQLGFIKSIIAPSNPGRTAIDLCLCSMLVQIGLVKPACSIMNDLVKVNPSRNVTAAQARLALHVGDISYASKLLNELAELVPNTDEGVIEQLALNSVDAFAQRDYGKAEANAITAHTRFQDAGFPMPVKRHGLAAFTIWANVMAQREQYRTVLMIEDAIRRQPQIYCCEAVAVLLVDLYKSSQSARRAKILITDMKLLMERFGPENMDTSMFSIA